MVDKKTGYLFPEIETAPKQTKRRKPRKESLSQEALKKIQTTKEKQIRLKIIQGIAKSDVIWANEVLIQALEDPSEDIRDFIIKELGNKEKLDLKLLYKRINKSPWYVKTGCLRVLGLKKNVSSVKHIESLINNPNIEVRRTLAKVLGEIGGKSVLSLLTQLTKDKSAFVRASAEKSLLKTSQAKFS
ncbi:MAG: HEAT repeat domain-containing protein [Candidatus Aminicenantes bacterium]|nr:HEAT repeat domain-containing protein [Candidatus Aminicenantes bacterium]